MYICGCKVDLEEMQAKQQPKSEVEALRRELAEAHAELEGKDRIIRVLRKQATFRDGQLEAYRFALNALGRAESAHKA